MSRDREDPFAEMAPLQGYTAPRAFAAEGARVALVSCLRCGAALLLDPDDEEDAIVLHDDWHNKTEKGT